MKKSVTKKICWTVGVLSFLATAAHAGEREGHGGVGVVCTKAGKITSVTMLDQFEGEEQYQLDLRDSSESVDVQLNRIVEKLASFDPESAKRLDSEIARMRASQRLLDMSNVLLPTDDAFPIIGPRHKNCGFAQVATYSDREETLFLDPKLTPFLSQTGMTALFAHEAIYKLARSMNQAKNSIDSRELVARLLESQISNMARTVNLINRTIRLNPAFLSERFVGKRFRSIREVSDGHAWNDLYFDAFDAKTRNLTYSTFTGSYDQKWYRQPDQRLATYTATCFSQFEYVYCKVDKSYEEFYFFPEESAVFTNGDPTKQDWEMVFTRRKIE